MYSIGDRSMSSILLISAFYSAASIAADAQTPATDKSATTVVLVHGAFADGSSWNEIIPLLQAKGLKVVAVQNPLTSLADDVEFTSRAIDAQTGPVVLVGHSWGGTVITQVGVNPKVKALVFVAAFAPSVGESSLDGVKGFPASPGMANPVVGPSGFVTLSPQAIADGFAQDLPAAKANLIAVTQGAMAGKLFEERVTAAAWETKPSWYIVAAMDRIIHPDAERAYARKIRATVVTLRTSHVAMLSMPQDVAAVILDAARSVK